MALNPTKMEMIWFDSHANLQKIATKRFSKALVDLTQPWSLAKLKDVIYSRLHVSPKPVWLGRDGSAA